MPNIRSAEKRMRSDAKKRITNLACISELKTLGDRLKKMAGEPAKARELAVKVISRYDRAVSRGIIPRGRADRKKSRIAKFLSGLKSA
ncbi:MAG: 30S ribosomal protein S20 [Candidatus Omnitrophica bacterium]|nr:30S ribosomal protein S20 [Candidatus Omnitrophota bacterium]